MPSEPTRLVAETNRLLYMEGLVGPSGHVSVCDSADGIVYTNPFTVSRGEIRPEDVVAVTYENELIDPDDPHPVGEAEIHTSIYRTRENVNAVLHVHPPAATLFSIAGVDLVPISIRGSILDGPVPVLNRPDKITNRADSEHMLAAMGDANQLLIRGHGAVVVDRNIKRAFARVMYLERNARYQLYASILGDPVQLTSEEIARLKEQNWNTHSIDKRWHYYRWKARENAYLPEEW